MDHTVFQEITHVFKDVRDHLIELNAKNFSVNYILFSNNISIHLQLREKIIMKKIMKEVRKIEAREKRNIKLKEDRRKKRKYLFGEIIREKIKKDNKKNFLNSSVKKKI